MMTGHDDPVSLSGPQPCLLILHYVDLYGKPTTLCLWSLHYQQKWVNLTQLPAASMATTMLMAILVLISADFY